jgi:hypothetical protein
MLVALSLQGITLTAVILIWRYISIDFLSGLLILNLKTLANAILREFTRMLGVSLFLELPLTGLKCDRIFAS